MKNNDFPYNISLSQQHNPSKVLLLMEYYQQQRFVSQQQYQQHREKIYGTIWVSKTLCFVDFLVIQSDLGLYITSWNRIITEREVFRLNLKRTVWHGLVHSICVIGFSQQQSQQHIKCPEIMTSWFRQIHSSTWHLDKFRL